MILELAVKFFRQRLRIFNHWRDVVHMYVCRVWDEADYVVPPAENGAFFITTNLLVTPNQTQVVTIAHLPISQKLSFLSSQTSWLHQTKPR